MSTAPQWSATDDTTADLLSLVADPGHPSADFEWAAYLDALHDLADHTGRVDPNALRERVRGVVAPHRCGSFARRAQLQGVVRYTGEYVVSTDTTSRNCGKPLRCVTLTDPTARVLPSVPSRVVASDRTGLGRDAVPSMRT